MNSNITTNQIKLQRSRPVAVVFFLFSFLSYLPFSLKADPGWNKTAMTVPKSFIKSISTCSPRVVWSVTLERKSSDKPENDLPLLETHVIDYKEGRRREQNPSGPKWVECVWRRVDGVDWGGGGKKVSSEVHDFCSENEPPAAAFIPAPAFVWNYF